MFLKFLPDVSRSCPSVPELESQCLKVSAVILGKYSRKVPKGSFLFSLALLF